MSEPDENPRLHDYQGWTCPKCAKGEHEDCLVIRRTGKLRTIAVRDEVCMCPCPCPYPDHALPDDTVLFLVRDSVERRRGLIHGRLHDGRGHHCAIGAMWHDNPTVLVSAALLEEIATVNDSVPPSATAQQRWRKVRSWLRWKLRVLATGKRR